MKPNFVSAGMTVLYTFVLLASPFQAYAAETKTGLTIGGKISATFGGARFGPGLEQGEPLALPVDAPLRDATGPVLDLNAGTVADIGDGKTPTVLATAQGLAAVADGARDGALPPAAVEQANRKTFDVGGEPAPPGSDNVVVVGGGDGGGNIGGGGFGNGGGASNGGNGVPLGYIPRVTFIEGEIFSRPVGEQTIQYIEKLLDTPGAHVVLLTSRPIDGRDSAEKFFLSKLKGRRKNPVVVVSENGGKISLDGKKDVLDEFGAFSTQELSELREIDAEIRKALGVAAPSAKAPAEGHTYNWNLPKEVAAADQERAMRRAFDTFKKRLEGTPFEVVRVPGNPKAISIHPMALGSSLDRLKMALKSEFPNDEDLQNGRGRMLALVKSPELGRAIADKFPTAEVKITESEESVVKMLISVLFRKALEPVTFKLGSLVSFLYKERRDRRVPAEGEEAGWGNSGGQGGQRQFAGGDSTERQLDGYVGSVIYTLMAWVVKELSRNNPKMMGRRQIEEKLADIFFRPNQNYVFVPPSTGVARKTEAWSNRQVGHLNKAKAFLDRIYEREFRDLNMAASDMMENLVRVATSRTRGVVELIAAVTPQIFRIHVNIHHLMIRNGVLTAYAYRTGQMGDSTADKLRAQVWAIFILRKLCSVGPDGKWRLLSERGKVIDRIDIQFEYFEPTDPWSFKPEDVLAIKDGKAVDGPIATEVTNVATRAAADKDFMEAEKQLAFELREAEKAAAKDLEQEKAKKKPVQAKFGFPKKR